MSSDEDDGPREEPQSLDDNGYPIALQASTGGKLQAQLNPLQLKMAAMKAAAEDKAKKDAKKAALASRAAAFGSIKDDGKGAKAAVEEPKAAAGSKVPELEKARLDGKVVDMMRSAYCAPRALNDARSASLDLMTRSRVRASPLNPVALPPPSPLQAAS